MTFTDFDHNIKDLVAEFDNALEQLGLARQTDRMASNRKALAAALLVMEAPGGLDALYARVPMMEAKGGVCQQ